MKTIVLGGGCFWCIEAVYQRVKGVTAVRSGYAGGSTPSPVYDNHADHAEVVEVTYDDRIIDLSTILDVFFHVHDPTTPNRQGNDVGTQYRSIVLYADEEEKATIDKAIAGAQADWSAPIVTEVTQLSHFTEAEAYHQNYYNTNQAKNPYCQIVINPKLEKFFARFAQLTKD